MSALKQKRFKSRSCDCCVLSWGGVCFGVSLLLGFWFLVLFFGIFFLEKHCISLSLSSGNVIENQREFWLVINSDLDSYHILMFLII